VFARVIAASSDRPAITEELQHDDNGGDHHQ